MPRGVYDRAAAAARKEYDLEKLASSVRGKRKPAKRGSARRARANAAKAAPTVSVEPAKPEASLRVEVWFDASTLPSRETLLDWLRVLTDHGAEVKVAELTVNAPSTVSLL
jgi:hypothetical protein